MGLYNKTSQETKCRKNIIDILVSCTTFFFLPYFEVICDLLLNRQMTT